MRGCEVARQGGERRSKGMRGDVRACEGMLREVVDVMDEYFSSAKEDGCRPW